MRNRTLDPNGNPSDVDWSRGEVLSRAADSAGVTHTPLGDPTRWGGLVTTRPISGTLGGFDTSPQFIRAQSSDLYGRNWSIVGTVRAPLALFYNQDQAPHPPNPFPPGFVGWAAGLDVSFGVGQNTIRQRFNLRAIINADSPWYNPEPDDLAAQMWSAPFVIPGAICAVSIAIFAAHVYVPDPSLVLPVGVAPLPAEFTITTSAQLAPWNAGTGL